jgi:hypothetical protein
MVKKWSKATLEVNRLNLCVERCVAREEQTGHAVSKLGICGEHWEHFNQVLQVGRPVFWCNLSCETTKEIIETTWVWINTYRYIFSGMNIHLPAILGFTRYQGFDSSPHINILCQPRNSPRNSQLECSMVPYDTLPFLVFDQNWMVEWFWTDLSGGMSTARRKAVSRKKRLPT